jgi:hypothetical protein
MSFPEDPAPLSDPKSLDAEPQLAWETPGSSGATASIVGGGAVAGATLLGYAAIFILPMVGWGGLIWAVQPAVSGLGAALGGWVAWAALGRT